jgi:glycosyltransferase involved in cell wall biosynthesis
VKIGILASHPIQYHAPLYRALAAVCDLDVFYAHRQDAEGQAASGFAKGFDWDVDLLDGYRSRFLRNEARVPDAGAFRGCDTPEIRGVISRGGFDGFIVMGWHLQAYWQALAACRKAGVPCLARSDSQLLPPPVWLKRIVKAVVYPRLLGRFAGFLVPGRRSRDYLRRYGIADARIFDVPYSVDTELFKRDASGDRDAVRAEMGAGPGDLLLLSIGKFIPLKRMADVIAAVARLRGRNVPARLCLIGSGPLDAELRSQAAQCDAPVRFLDFRNQSQLPRYYRAADLLVLASDSETWGMVVNEAFACGAPAVVSDAVGCAPDLIRPGVTGDTFPVGDVDALAGKISEFGMRCANAEVDAALREMTATNSPARAAASILTAIESAKQWA